MSSTLEFYFSIISLACKNQFAILSGRNGDNPVAVYWKGNVMAERILRRPDVEARTGLSRSTIYEWMKRGEFPQPVALGARLVGWSETDIEAWLAARESKVA